MDGISGAAVVKSRKVLATIMATNAETRVSVKEFLTMIVSNANDIVSGIKRFS